MKFQWPGANLLRGEPSTLRGMAFISVAAFCGAAMSAIIRYLSDGMHPFEIVFFRCLFGFLVLAPVFFRYGLTPLKTRRLGMHLLRGGLNVAVMLLFFMAVSLLPLAKVIALSFSSPLFSSLLAVILLGEALRAPRIVGLVVGFSGTLVILRPGVIELDLGALCIMGYAVTWALAMIVIKVLSRTESSLTIALYIGVLATPIAFLAALPVWQAPSLIQLAWLVLLGALGALAHLTLAQAFKEADVTAVLPVDFTRLIWAALLGYLVFAEVPDVWTWVGAVAIVAAVTFIAYRERYSARRPASGEPQARPPRGEC